MHKKLFGLCFSLIAMLCFASAALAKNNKVEIADNAPDSYVVRKGDTLWAISGMFLKQPWRWPEVWNMNKAEIRNPHLIYPGQTVYLDRNGPRLSLSKHSETGDGKLSPKVYETPADAPITSVSLDAIKSFLVEPLVDEGGDDSSLPTVVAFEENRVVGGPGQSLFAKNLGNVTDQWSIYRRGKPIKDPETDEVLGYEAMYVGAAVTAVPAKDGKAAEMKIVKAVHEISIGDRLQPVAKSELLAFAPHAPAPSTRGRIAAIYGGVGGGGSELGGAGRSYEVAGRYSVIAVNLGKKDGLEPGHVLGIDRNRGVATYKEDGKKEEHALPDGRIGLGFVFRVFNKISYVLVMESEQAIYVGDKVLAP